MVTRDVFDDFIRKKAIEAGAIWKHINGIEAVTENSKQITITFTGNEHITCQWPSRLTEPKAQFDVFAIQKR